MSKDDSLSSVLVYPLKYFLYNQKNDTSADYSEEIEEGVKEKFTIYFKRENLKLLPGDYDVSISSKGVSHFKSAGKNLEYWIALEPNSQYS